MLFMCGWPAYRGVSLTFLYVISESPDQQHQQLEHSVRFGDDGPLRKLTDVQGPMTPDWLAATDVEPGDCILDNTTSLADVQNRRGQRPPLYGNVTTYNFSVSNTYKV